MELPILIVIRIRLRKLLLSVAENISIAIKGKRKVLIMEISPTDVLHTTVRCLVKEGPLSSIITTLLPQAAQKKNVDYILRGPIVAILHEERLKAVIMNNSNKEEFNIQDKSSRETFVIMNIVLNAPLMLVSILGNSLVLAAILRSSAIRSTTMIMLCSLAVSDLLVGLVAQPCYLAALLKTGNLTTSLSVMVGFSVCGVTLWTTTAISVDRFLALHYHMRYHVLVTKSRVKHTLSTIWLINVPFSGLYLWKQRGYKLAIAIMTVICLTISTFSYSLIYRIVRRHKLQMSTQQQVVQSVAMATAPGNKGVHISRMKKSAMNMFVFYIFLILCYIPMYILLTLHGLSFIDWTIQWNFITVLVFMNSAINPFLYCWRLRELREAVVKTVRKLICTQTGESGT